MNPSKDGRLSEFLLTVARRECNIAAPAFLDFPTSQKKSDKI